jgi:hypothetical protein
VKTISTGEVHDDIIYPSALPFVLVHTACFGAIWSGITWQAVAICATLYWLRIFAIGAGYHRYFSHRSYSTGRVFQFVLALLAQTSAQKSVLWWAAKHRHHHLHSDTGQDVHSPRHKGFLYSHVGWIFARQHDSVDLVKVADLARYPELIITLNPRPSIIDRRRNSSAQARTFFRQLRPLGGLWPLDALAQATTAMPYVGLARRSRPLATRLAPNSP